MARRFSRLSVQDAGNSSRMKFTLDKLMADLETSFGAVDDSIAALAAAAAAQADATSALANAATAQTAADTAKKNDKISASWTSPGSVLSASDAGANATIAIAAHTRNYGDGTNVSVSSGSLTGKSYSTAYYIYYNDASLAGGSVTYVATTSATTAAPNKTSGRHFVGKVTTPAAAAPPTTGGTIPPGGYAGSNEYENID